MHSRDSSVQILEMSDFDELADFADLFTVPPTAKSPYSARPESIAYPSGIPLELDMFDEDEGFRNYGVERSKSSAGSSSERASVNPGGFLVELDDLGDDTISPTLPSFDLTRRVSRDQTGSSDETGSTATRTSGLVMPIVFSIGTAGNGVGSKESAGRMTMSTRLDGRPASLAATLRPRRASTGDWVSLYDPQTPTAIVDLERMAREFPSIPRSVGEEMEDENSEAIEAGRRAKGLMGSLDHDQFDSIAHWQRQCCINNIHHVNDGTNKDTRRIVSWDPRPSCVNSELLDCSVAWSNLASTAQHRRHHRILRRTLSTPDLTTSTIERSFQARKGSILKWLPFDMAHHLETEVGIQHNSHLHQPHEEMSKDSISRRSSRISLYSNSNRHPPQLPRVPEESSLSGEIHFSSPPQLPLRQIPLRSSAHSVHSSRSVETSLSIPSLALSHNEFSPSTSTSTDAGLMTSSSSGSGTFGAKSRLGGQGRQGRGGDVTIREELHFKAFVRDIDGRAEEDSLYSPLVDLDLHSQRPATKSKAGGPSLTIDTLDRSISLGPPLSKDLNSNEARIKGLDDPNGASSPMFRVMSEGNTYRFPVTPDEGNQLFFDVNSVLEKDKENRSVSGSIKGDRAPLTSNSHRGTEATASDLDVHSIFATSSASQFDARKNQVWESIDRPFTLGEPISSGDHQKVIRSSSISTSGSKSVHSLSVPSNNQTIKPHQSYSSSSRRSSYAQREGNPDSASLHPFASRNSPSLSPGSFGLYNHHTGMPSPSLVGSARGMTHSVSMPQVTLVPPEDTDKLDDEVCVICCESLNPLYRLSGEKPNVTSVCGHSLHHACFTAVYGPVKLALSRRDLGVCGVCRQPMRLDEDDMFQGSSSKTGGNVKFAAMMGLEREGTAGSRRGNSATVSSRGAMPGDFNNLLKSPLGDASSLSSFASSAETGESTADDPVDSFRKTSTGSSGLPPQVVIPMITVKAEHTVLAKKVDNAKRGLTCMITVQVPPSGRRPSYAIRTSEEETSSSTTRSLNGDSRPGITRSRTMGGLNSAKFPSTPDTMMSPSSARSLGPDPFAHVAADLKQRLSDFKTSGLDTLGRIRLFDILQVRKGQYVIDIMVFLYDAAIVCVAEEKKRGLKQLLSSSSSSTSLRGGEERNTKKVKTPLKLKGRIYFRDVSRIVESSLAGELSVTIQMKAANIESFILVFRDKSAQSLWMNTLNMALSESNGGVPLTPISPPTSSTSTSKLARMGIQENVVSATQARKDSLSSSVSVRTTGDPSVGRPLAPVHTPIDLVCIVPIPSTRSPSSASSSLKLDLVTSTLNFVLAALGNHDRVCLVAYQAGRGGWVKRTPFLNSTRGESRKRLDRFVLSLVDGSGDAFDEFAVEGPKDEQVDIISAVNAALDNTLQRKGKNPISGMIVVSDTGGISSRASMDLVIARLEAACVPIHAVGYTKSHEPSPLWLLSNATHGTYVSLTNEWNQLRDVCAGILGGLMSIAMTSVKLSLAATVPEFRIRRIQGAQSTIISTDGHSSEIELGHLVSGSKIEVLIDMERERNPHRDEMGEPSDEEAHSPAHSQAHSAGSSLHKVKKTGSFTNGESQTADSNLNQLWEEGALDEIPLLTVDCQYMDPSAGRQIARLSDPRLLMVTLSSSQPSKQTSAPDILRRKAELLASESMTRAVLLVSRNNWPQARRIISETSKILAFNLSNAMNSIPNSLQRATPSAVRKETEAQLTTHLYSAILEDLDVLSEGCEEEVKEVFEREQRTYSAQQALILRKQLSWTARSATEQLYITEGSQELLNISRGWLQQRS